MSNNNKLAEPSDAAAVHAASTSEKRAPLHSGL